MRPSRVRLPGDLFWWNFKSRWANSLWKAASRGRSSRWCEVTNLTTSYWGHFFSPRLSRKGPKRWKRRDITHLTGKVAARAHTIKRATAHATMATFVFPECVLVIKWTRKFSIFCSSLLLSQVTFVKWFMVGLFYGTFFLLLTKHAVPVYTTTLYAL